MTTETNEDRDSDRKASMRQRFNRGSQTSQASSSSETSDSSQTSQTSQEPVAEQTELAEETPQTSRDDDRRGSVTDENRSITMYVPDELVEEVGLTFDELKPQVKRATGRSIEKNRDFYPELLKKGIENISSEDFEDSDG